LMRRKKKVYEKKSKERGKKKLVTIRMNKPFIGKALIVNFARVCVGIGSLVLLFVVLQKPYVNKSLDVLGASSGFHKVPAASKPALDWPDLTAKSAIVVSTKKSKTLFAKNIDLKLPPASTTKMLTALLAIREFDLAEEVEVPAECTKIDGSSMKLVSAEKVNVESLLYGLLVASAGDAACTLSVHKFSSGTFVVKMNKLAGELGLTNTVFNNPVGLDVEGKDQYSSSRDLYLMAKEAMKNGVFRKIVGTKEVSFPSLDGKRTYNIKSTNRLLFDVPGSLGIKTGKTDLAKEVLVYAYQNHDDELIIVVMGSEDRFADTKALLNFTLANYFELISN
ncbi:D-alanyl-D-alanine carboxypeptidase, partial [candidate division WWE3 bacterium]|nr:D-alanyl-D-alanine carboxypeptidase [candidate division WWE3 bacterium]